MKLVSVAQMRAIESEANTGGLTFDDMMQHAGEGLAQVILGEFKDEVHVLYAVGLVGTGNNGGDTLVALSKLVDSGWSACAYIVGSRPAQDPLISDLQGKNIQVYTSGQDLEYDTLDELVSQADVLIDGILGTGIKLPLKPEVARILGHIAAIKDLPSVVAVDCPSGVNCDTGECAPEVIPADLTVCMAAVKQGLLRFPAFEKIGQLQVVDIGLPEGLKSWSEVKAQVVTQAETTDLLPKRPQSAHKGTFGTALVVAGSINYTGAAYLAAKAAYRIGAGLVRLAVPGPLHLALAGQLPEVTWLLLPHDTGVISEAAAEVLLKNLDKADALLIGPGLSLEDPTANFIRRLMNRRPSSKGHGAMGFLPAGEGKIAAEKSSSSEQTLPPLVIDADGLKLLARLPDWPKLLPPGTVLTPHPGEMSILTGLPVSEIQADRLKIAVRFAEEWNLVVVLKGALTVISAPGQGARVIPVATPALARAGTGDVLSGIIVGLIAQKMAPFEAAIAGAWIHAHAGLEAESYLESSASVLASDVLESIPMVLSTLK
jgi:ADP-dependent NAD(P)H-hydrate dehydratase / NAD(P)H-hydrate epimerase